MMEPRAAWLLGLNTFFDIFFIIFGLAFEFCRLTFVGLSVCLIYVPIGRSLLTEALGVGCTVFSLFLYFASPVTVVCNGHNKGHKSLSKGLFLVSISNFISPAICLRISTSSSVFKALAAAVVSCCCQTGLWKSPANEKKEPILKRLLRPFKGRKGRPYGQKLMVLMSIQL